FFENFCTNSSSFVNSKSPVAFLPKRPKGFIFAVVAFATKSITVIPLALLSVVEKPFGLFNKTYVLGSGLRRRPSKRTASFNSTLWPISFILFPFTVTKPVAIYVSASRREQTPLFAIYLFKRIPSSGLLFFTICTVGFSRRPISFPVLSNFNFGFVGSWCLSSFLL